MNTYDVKELLSDRLEKTAWMRQNANSYNLASGVQLEPLLQQIQGVVNQRVQLVAKKAEIHPSVPIQKDWNGNHEKLLNLYLHLNTQNPKDPKGLLFNFCNQVYLTSRHIRAWKLIGQVVFLAERIPGKLAAGIDAHPEKIDGSSLFIEEKLCEEFEKIAEEVALTFLQAATFTFKEDRQELSVEISKKLAKMLLTPEGNLNFGLIASIEKYFLPLVSITAAQRPVLKCLNISLENHLNKVAIPDQKQSSSYAMICADLNLHPDTKLTELHCKQEVLGALLNLPNSSSFNSYLKVAQAIDIEDQFFQNACKDFIEILSKGYLTRDICNKKECFFFESAVFDPILRDNFILLKDGCISKYKYTSFAASQKVQADLHFSFYSLKEPLAIISQTPGCFEKLPPFWKCPYLIGACRLMGINDLDEHKDVFLKQIFLSDDRPQEMNWDQIIQKFAQQIQIRSTEETVNLGRYGFSRKFHRLLQAWEATLFAFGQAQPDDLIRSKIHYVVMRALSKTFLPPSSCPKSLYHAGLVGKIQAAYKRALNDSICLVYHPALPYQNSFDEEVFLPGFKLHDRDQNNLTQKGARIATPIQMMGWFCKVVDILQASTEQMAASEEDKKVLASVIVALYERVQEEQFLTKIIRSYDKNNIAQLDPNASYKNFKRTPMTTLQCEKSWGVSALEMNQNFIPHYLVIRPNHPEELLQWLLDYAKWNGQFKSPIKGVFSNPSEKIVFEKGLLGSWVESGLTSAQWVEKKIIIPGKEVSQKTITEEEVLCFSQGAKQWLQQSLINDLSLETAKDVDLLFNRFCFEKHSIQSFAQHTLFAFESISNLNPKQKTELPLIWDTVLLQSLSQKKLEKLKESCVRFIKYKESISSNEQYICCFLNPRTEEVELASINKKTTQIIPFGKWDGIK